MSVFKFTDAVRVGWKAAKRPSCSSTSCQLPATASSWLRRLESGQLDRNGEYTRHQSIVSQEDQPTAEQILMMSIERVVHQPRSIVHRRSVVQAPGSPVFDGIGGKDQACRGHGWW